MIAIGTIAAIRASSEGIRIDARVHKELRKDLLVYGPVNVIATIAKGDRVVVHGIEGNDVEQFATPIQVMPDNGAHRIIADDIRLGSGNATDPVALKSDLVALLSAITDAPVAPMDGGASFKAAIVAALANWPVSAQKVKAE